MATTGKSYREGAYAFPAFSCGMTYWNWTLDPICNDAGQIVHLLLTANSITPQVVARQQNELPHIFKRFHRASTIDRSISGLGLGLYLEKELVALHEGKVWTESMEGQGTTFFVRLPLHAVEKGTQ